MNNSNIKPISGIVTTLNEEANIRGAVESLLQVCDEVIVVDSCSTFLSLTYTCQSS